MPARVKVTHDLGAAADRSATRHTGAVQLFGDVSAQYTDFASYAHGESPCFEEWARGVAADEEILALIAALPPVKQQPNLVFAAARWHRVPAPAPYATFRNGLLSAWETIRATVLSRSTQTNEVGRLAILLPAFSWLQTRHDRPLALIEVGASAGLCLFPDCYDYQWVTSTGDHWLRAARDAPAATVLRCTVSGPAPLPARPPVFSWRAGLDLNPLDVRDDEAMAWLQHLVWPEQDERRTRLAAAIEVARRSPARLVRGDVFATLPGLLSQAPPEATVVVFHSAVVAYLEVAERARFQALMTGLVADGGCHWVSNEGRLVLPDITATGPAAATTLPFVLGIDGQAVAWTHGHGAALNWVAPEPWTN